MGGGAARRGAARPYLPQWSAKMINWYRGVILGEASGCGCARVLVCWSGRRMLADQYDEALLPSTEPYRNTNLLSKTTFTKINWNTLGKTLFLIHKPSILYRNKGHLRPFKFIRFYPLFVQLFTTSFITRIVFHKRFNKYHNGCFLIEYWKCLLLKSASFSIYSETEKK